MKNNKTQTIFLVLLNVTLIFGFSFIFFNGGLENVFTGDRNMYQPAEGHITSSGRVISSLNALPPHQSVITNSKHDRTDDENQVDNTIPVSSNSESMSRVNTNRKSRNLSSSSSSNEILAIEDRQTLSGVSANFEKYSGVRKGGVAVTEGNYTSLNGGSKPFTDGISSFPRSSVPRGQGSTILIDPMTDPEEKKRIPVGNGMGVLLVLAAAFAARKLYSSRMV